MQAFLFRYSGVNTEGYRLVYASCEDEAIQKLKEHLWFIDSLFIENATIK